MKFAFISDIHGNAVALEAVLEDIQRKKVSKIYVLGDLCFRGPEPKRCLELVQSLNAEVIRGNADEWVIRGVRDGEVPDSALEIMQREREWTVSQLDEKSIAYINELPNDLNLEFGKIKVHAFHATPNSLFEVIAPTETDEIIEEKMMGREADIFIYGHIHKSYIRYINGRCIINTGSVGLPFDGIAKSSYFLLDIEGGSFQTSIVRVDYDVKKVINQLIQSNYPNYKQMCKVLENGTL
jgi:putative phosphoesterase